MRNLTELFKQGELMYREKYHREIMLQKSELRQNQTAVDPLMELISFPKIFC